MSRTFLLIASLLGMASVALGAFGAHVLKQHLSEYHLQIFETGVRYQFYHALALLGVAVLGRYLSRKWINVAGWLFVAGVVCFSGSLYLLAFSEVIGLDSFKPLIGPVTPLGGVLFMAGWLSLFRASFDYKAKH